MTKGLLLTVNIILIICLLAFSSCSEDPPTKPIVTAGDPELVQIDPEAAQNGDLIRLYGKNFGEERGTSYVIFGELKAAGSDYSLWNDSLIIMTVPQSALTGYIKVVVGGKESEQIFFTVGTAVGPPLISRIRPDKAFTGDTITIDGANFLNTRDTSYIEIHGKKLNDTDYMSWTGSKIVFSVPQDAEPASGKLKIYVGGQGSNDVNFTIQQQQQEDPPVILYIESNIALVGDTIQIHGTDFADLRKNHSGYAVVGGVQADEMDGYVDWKDQLILVIVPEGAKTGKVYVSKDGMKSNEVDFTLGSVQVEEPFIESVSNTMVRPNQSIDLYGKHFGPSQGLNDSVTFGGSKLSRAKIPTWEDQLITIQVPADAQPGNYDIIVYADDIASNSVSVTVIETQQKYFIETVLISAGSFTMGTSEDDLWANPDHEVTLTRDFNMGIYEVTQEEWEEASSSYPDYAPDDKGPNKPAHILDWYRIVEWCNNASKKDGLDECYTINGITVSCDFSKNGYRLPTEAEWEYACRAGTQGDVNFTGNLDDYAWTRSNSQYLQEVGLKNANPLGLYDMYGNVAEWCWDWLEEYSSASVTDPKGPSTFEGNGKVARGGSILSTSNDIKSWYRTDVNPELRGNRDLGFRVVRNK
ncbi:SUMF1/EgtB/PvdO family nonheme iron enzyme [Bacteroidota bacterium]